MNSEKNDIQLLFWRLKSTVHTNLIVLRVSLNHVIYSRDTLFRAISLASWATCSFRGHEHPMSPLPQPLSQYAAAPRHRPLEGRL